MRSFQSGQEMRIQEPPRIHIKKIFGSTSNSIEHLCRRQTELTDASVAAIFHSYIPLSTPSSPSVPEGGLQRLLTGTEGTRWWQSSPFDNLEMKGVLRML